METLLKINFDKGSSFYRTSQKHSNQIYQIFAGMNARSPFEHPPTAIGRLSRSCAHTTSHIRIQRDSSQSNPSRIKNQSHLTPTRQRQLTRGTPTVSAVSSVSRRVPVKPSSQFCSSQIRNVRHSSMCRQSISCTSGTPC